MTAFVNTFIFPAAFALLPPAMDTPDARAHLLAIGLQESKFEDRRQVLDSGNPGPARSFFQFELAGVAAVLSHPVTRKYALKVLEELRIEPAPARVLAAMEFCDVLAVCFARLLLYTLPGSLPSRKQANKGWTLYVEAWRPGKPHEATWDAHFARAWALVSGEAA